MRARATLPSPRSSQGDLHQGGDHLKAASESILDIFQAPLEGQQDVRSVCRADIHRNVLAFQMDQPALAFHGGSFSVQYAHSDPAIAARLWALGYMSVVAPAAVRDRLQWGDLSIDIVIMNSSAVDFLSGHLNRSALDEAVRILIPSGFLILSDSHAKLPLACTMSQLLGPTVFANVFLRANVSIDGIEGLGSCDPQSGCAFPPNPLRLGNPEESVEQRPCQPVIAKPGDEYISLTDAGRIQKALSSPDLAVGRFRTAYPSGSRWFSGFDRGHGEQERYTGQTAPKPEFTEHPKLVSLVRDGNIKSVLDAGAGTCTLYGAFLERNFLGKLDRFMSFGGYNCPMLRLCGERGTISMEYNWLNPLPFCNSCKFDLVFQAQGVHHNPNKTAHLLMLNNFDSVLVCGGWLSISDAQTGPGPDWVPVLLAWAKERGYKFISRVNRGTRPMILVRKLCEQGMHSPRRKLLDVIRSKF